MKLDSNFTILSPKVFRQQRSIEGTIVSSLFCDNTSSPREISFAISRGEPRYAFARRTKYLFLLTLVLLVLVGNLTYGQDYDTLSIVSYNLLNYPGSTSAARNPEFRKIINSLSPDLLVVQEMTSTAGTNEFLTNVLNVSAPPLFTAVLFHDGPDTDNGVYYRADKWEFIRASYIPTALRDIAEYIVRPVNSSQQLRIYSVHLKASSGSANEQKRSDEATILRNHLDSLAAGTNFIIVGDYNIYTSGEGAFQKLIATGTSSNGQAFDPLNLNGNWSGNAAFAPYHTQSPRVRSFGGGSTGGMDDRFDIILTSTSMSSKILTSTYKAYGNDSNHFNDSINRLPNAAVPDSIANALHNASDHLPVTAKFVFPRTNLPIQLAYFNGSLNSTRDSVVVRWGTLSETNNFGFEVQKRSHETSEFQTIPNSFVPGHGTTLDPHYYRFAEQVTTSGNMLYRLKQIDLDGTIHYTEPIQITLVTSVSHSTPLTYSLSQNYPNPFNPSTQIRFSTGHTGYTAVVVYDILGREVASLFNAFADAGKEYSILFDGHNANGSPLPSGVYFYRLRPASETSTILEGQTGRMILVR